jgi:hypothetical protein
MNRTRTTLAAAAGIALLATACSSELTYGQAADQCTAAVKALPKGAQISPRPKPCERLTEKDYNVLFMAKVAADNGWTDANGAPDLNKMITSTPSP